MKRINLIPEEAKKLTPKLWLKKRLLKSRALKVIVLAIILLFAINMWQASSILRHKHAIASGKKKIAELRIKLTQSKEAAIEVKKEKGTVDDEIKRVAQKFGLLRKIQGRKSAWTIVLTRLSEIVPQNLWINNINMDKELITIVGTTFDNEIVSKFMEQLDESEYFEKTSFNYTQKKEFNDKPVIGFEVTTHAIIKKISQ